MPSHGLYGETRGIRWDEEQQCFTAKCDRCASMGITRSYWPLTLDFWNPRSMQRCRACNAEVKRFKQRERMQSPEERARSREYARAYYASNHAVIRMKQREYKRRLRARQRGRSMEDT